MVKHPKVFILNVKCSKCGNKETIGIIEQKDKIIIGPYYKPKQHIDDDVWKNLNSLTIVKPEKKKKAIVLGEIGNSEKLKH